MTKRFILKVYVVVFLLLFVAGNLKSVINGYRYFCEGFQACDQSGQVLEWGVFFQRHLDALGIAGLGAAFITFMMLKDREQDKSGPD